MRSGARSRRTRPSCLRPQRPTRERRSTLPGPASKASSRRPSTTWNRWDGPWRASWRNGYLGGGSTATEPKIDDDEKVDSNCLGLPRRAFPRKCDGGRGSRGARLFLAWLFVLRDKFSAFRVRRAVFCGTTAGQVFLRSRVHDPFQPREVHEGV